MEFKNVKLLTWFNFFTDFKLYAPVAIIYFAQVTNSYALGMSIFSIAMISSALLEIPTGIFSDRIGRKRTIILGAIFATLCAIFYAIGHSFWILAFGALLEGVARSFYSGNNEALLYETLAEKNEEHEYPEALGHTSKMFQLALGVSAIVGAFLLNDGVFTLVMWLSVIPQALCIIIAFMLIEPKIHSRKSGNIYLHLKEAFDGFVHNRKLRLLSFSSILSFGFGEASYQFQSSFFATLWPLWAISLAKAYTNFTATLSFHYAGRVIKKYNVLKIILRAQILVRCMMIFSVTIPTILSPFIISSTSVFYGIMTVGRDSLMQKEFKKEQRATMGSLDSFAGSIVFGIVAFSLGAFADKFSPAFALLLIQGFQAINIFLYWKLFKSYSK